MAPDVGIVEPDHTRMAWAWVWGALIIQAFLVARHELILGDRPTLEPDIEEHDQAVDLEFRKFGRGEVVFQLRGAPALSLEPGSEVHAYLESLEQTEGTDDRIRGLLTGYATRLNELNMMRYRGAIDDSAKADRLAAARQRRDRALEILLAEDAGELVSLLHRLEDDPIEVPAPDERPTDEE
ncbi:MAG: hypothetical protein QGG40_08965 [Myxococcota bacterium]|jgi:hypothetical protein|nr:hypothetical protein [Myxococcota bacterium]